jgi:hypothetical protein
MRRRDFIASVIESPIDNDVALVNADAELDPLLLRYLHVALRHPALNLDSTAHGINDAGELDQHAVPRGLHDAAAVFGDLGVNQGAAMGLELGERALLVGTHQPAVASHIGRQDGREPSLHSLGDQGCPPGYVGGSLLLRLP